MGRYVVDEHLARGGTSDVYLATPVEGGAPVALKVLAGLSVGDRARADREARIAESLTHPNINRLLDHGTFGDDGVFLALEPLRGETLAVRLQRGPLPVDEVRALALGLLDALGYAHGRGLMHRDLKPANVFLRDGETRRPVLLDFGLARAVDAAPGLRFAGLQAYLGHLQHMDDLALRQSADEAAFATLKALVAELTAAGLPPPVVTGGGTGTHAYDLASGVYTELQAGSYAVMDVEYDACGAPDGAAWGFEPAMVVAATVVSANHKSHVTCDAGFKAVSTDGPPARVAAGAAPGSLWRAMGDEHGMIAHPALIDVLKAGGRDPLGFDRAVANADADPAREWPADAPKVGDIVWLQPGHCDPTINLYDALHVWDGETLERWPVDGRRVSTR